VSHTPSLFDDPTPPAGGTHAESLARVRGAIGAAVLAFVRERLATQPVFTISELHAYVTAARGVAPASPDRILRDGRQRGEYGYVLVSRRQSRYRVTWVKPEQGAA
jgi:hypothetical protein